MSTTKTQFTGYKHRILQGVMTKAYNTAASCRHRINETSISLVRKLSAGRIRHQWAMENLEAGKATVLDRILNTRNCADHLLRVDMRQYSEESRMLQAGANRLAQGPLRSVSEGLNEEIMGFQEWEEDTLKLLDNLAKEAEGLRGYLVELAGQAQDLGIEIIWWGDPRDDEAKVERLERVVGLDGGDPAYSCFNNLFPSSYSKAQPHHFEPKLMYGQVPELPNPQAS
ncbi:hypothetical protein C7212DRAFT_366984 [Tuber magnatum]|uniref:Uncharacterized protein n=1 Tax=Tuber magnatum TaxID=42249 RepID=A0A317SBX7_9PEZI|nr:hypothetical protein C7212DRAFT_366984 [Tuber magnatum]